MSATSELTPDITVIGHVNRNKSKHKVQSKPIKNEQGDNKFEVIDSNVKDTEDIEDNVIVDSVVYMAWTHPVLKGKEQFIIDTGCIGSHIFNDTELLTRRHKSSVQFVTSVAKPI